MMITFYSNYLNHHQLPICNEFLKYGNIEFKFIATEPISKERLKFGYEDINKKHNFVITTYDSKENYELALELGEKSDIVIIGSAPNIFIEKRLKDNEKITFRYSERIYKKLCFRNCISPLIGLRFLRNYNIDKKYYLLCSGAYSSRDYNLLGQFKNKSFKWGYFPEFNKSDIKEIVNNKPNDFITVLWVGRFLDWKHPEYCIKLAKYLNLKKYNNYKIKMIGIGKKYDEIKEMISKFRLNDKIELCGSMPNEKVLEEMKSANIFIFTSDRGEGWGAVLNESMNNGCAVVANKIIGSVPYLIENDKNGYIYNSGKEFLKKVEILINDREKRKNFGINAYRTIEDKWNAKVAVNNFIDLCEKIKENEKISEINYDNGPCSYIERK